jgi:phospholipase/carboxylesterase
MARVLAAVVVLALATACGSGDEGSSAAEKQRAQARAAAAANGRLTAKPPASPSSEPAKPGLHRLGQALLYVPPGDGSKRLVVTFHGATESPEGALALLRPYADRAGLMLLAPKSRGVTWDIVQGGFGPDVAALDRLLERVFAAYPVEGVAAAGFSDGASYALSLGLINGDLFDSVIAFSAGFIALGEPRGQPRLFVSHGTHDSVLPIGRTSRRGVPRLRASGYNVRYREFDGDHEVPPRIAREAVAWLVS